MTCFSARKNENDFNKVIVKKYIDYLIRRLFGKKIHTYREICTGLAWTQSRNDKHKAMAHTHFRRLNSRKSNFKLCRELTLNCFILYSKKARRDERGGSWTSWGASLEREINILQSFMHRF